MINIAFIREVGPLRWVVRTVVRQYYKRIVRRDHSMRLPTGEWLTLPIADHFASEAFITRADVDWGSECLFASMLEGKGAFLDVGAHIGYYTLYMLPRVQQVFSFEPDPRVLPLLEKNVAGKRNIEIIPCAVGAAEGRARFTLERDAEVSHLSATGEDSLRQLIVDVVTMDSFVTARDLIVEAIKIDVEGHDLAVIEGALGVMKSQQPLVLTEARPVSALFELARLAGYRVFAFVRHPRTRRKHFAELFADACIPGETKMLFLVPQRLRERFAGLATF